MWARDYIEKIVQKPVPLPKVRKEQVDRFFEQQIGLFFNEVGISKEEKAKLESTFPYVYQTQITKLIRNLRGVKRYLNGLRSTLPPIKSEVSIYDFLILELIRIFYPRVYDDIWENPWYYIPSYGGGVSLIFARFSSNEDEKLNKIKEHVQAVISKESNRDVLLELLKSIFFIELKNAYAVGGKTDHRNMLNTYRSERRITHPECFYKYFTLNVGNNEITDEYILQTIDKWNDPDNATEIEQSISQTITDLQRNRKLKEFLRLLIVFIDRIDTKLVAPILNSISQNIGRFSREGLKTFGIQNLMRV